MSQAQPPSVETRAAPISVQDWRRLHWLTPLLRGWKALAVLAAVGVQQGGDDLVRGNGPPTVEVALVAAGVVLAVVLLAVGWGWLSWRMTRYRVDSDVVRLERGVLNRQHRQARLDRLQAVDVVQPLVARLIGLAELKLEVAGGGGSDIRLSYLTEGEAQRVRNVLLARAAGLPVEAEQAPEAPELPVLEVPPGRVLMSLVLSGATVTMVVFVIGFVTTVAVSGSFAPLLGVLPAALGVVGVQWQRFSRAFSFRVAISPDGLRLRHGLLEHRVQTVPPGRVQAVRLAQPLWWRRPGWWRVQVNVAGYGGAPARSGESNETVLLPVGTRYQAEQVLSLVLPDLGVHEDEQARAVLIAGMSGSGSDGRYTASPRSARRLDPLSWRRSGYRVTDRAFLARRGRWHRQLDVVPHERTQSVGSTQGPLQRRLGLASFVLHSTPGPVSPRVDHLAADVVERLVYEQSHRARLARASVGPERWMSRPAPGVDLGKPAASPDPSGGTDR